MKKIFLFFKCDFNKMWRVCDEVMLGMEWVINGKGIVICKYDGICCLVKNGVFF